MSHVRTQELPTAAHCGERIAALRGKHGWSQRELARRVGCSYQLISKIEAGEVNTPIETLNRLAEGLDVSLERIVGGDDTPTSMVQRLLFWSETRRQPLATTLRSLADELDALVPTAS